MLTYKYIITFTRSTPSILVVAMTHLQLTSNALFKKIYLWIIHFTLLSIIHSSLYYRGRYEKQCFNFPFNIQYGIHLSNPYIKKQTKYFWQILLQYLGCEMVLATFQHPSSSRLRGKRQCVQTAGHRQINKTHYNLLCSTGWTSPDTFHPSTTSQMFSLNWSPITSVWCGEGWS